MSLCKRKKSPKAFIYLLLLLKPPTEKIRHCKHLDTTLVIEINIHLIISRWDHKLVP